MKLLVTSVLTSALLVVATTSQADLGDTYATSCQRFGTPTLINHRENTIVWNVGGVFVTEQFHSNQCVYVSYNTGLGSAGLTEAQLWNLLTRNSSRNQRWTEYPDPHPGRSFATNDGHLYGKYSLWPNLNGTGYVPGLRIAYKTWMDRHSLLEGPGSRSAGPPVEERIHRSTSAARSRVTHRPRSAPNEPDSDFSKI
jgi:hypothetical protein